MGQESAGRELKLLLGEDEQVEIRQNLPVRLAAPVRAGQKVGTVEYRLNGQTVRSFPVYTENGVARGSAFWRIVGGAAACRVSRLQPESDGAFQRTPPGG